MSITANLGYPRIGKHRELKSALEKYWAGKLDAAALQVAARQVRLENWQLQQSCGVQCVPCNDFSLYDQVLDTSWMIGAIPERFLPLHGKCSNLDLYFAMARGWQEGDSQIAAMEMTKWFDTNYHYIVPEISATQIFELNDEKVLREFAEAKEAGIRARPILLGPVSFLLLSKASEPGYRPLQALERLLPIYAEALRHLAAAGAEWVQIDEPCLVLDLDEEARAAYHQAYTALHQKGNPRILLATYFGEIGDNLQMVSELPVAGLHFDLVRAPQQLEAVLETQPAERVLSLGLVNGRNVWRTNLDAAIKMVKRAVEKRGNSSLQIAPNCSLLFCPQDLELETELDAEVKNWLAFARQKLTELTILNAVANGDEASVNEALAENRRIWDEHRLSAKVNNARIQKRLKEIRPGDYERRSPYGRRKAVQASLLKLPLLPTTTIGSFPQTAEVRRQRARFNQGELGQAAYELYLQGKIHQVVMQQEDLGLDVLVHGEFERTDMVEYFAEQLNGFAFTHHGWVQSYGSRAVRPPILYGDVSRPAAMTVKWSRYAQTLTQRPMKGMLTGPITILQWSFVRDDQPHELTCRQIALSLRDEVQDLEEAGIRIIQVDEPALREGLPLRRAEWGDYLRWAVDCFRLAVGAARDETQIHTHMCYGEFSDIMTAIARMDADVISIEASRSKMELLESFQQFAYPNDIGPGIYDIHSPRVPGEEEIESLLEKALQVIPTDRLWVNPDCGLKTRAWAEVLPALTNTVAAARKIRQKLELKK